jgi:transcription elongation factor GreA
MISRRTRRAALDEIGESMTDTLKTDTRTSTNAGVDEALRARLDELLAERDEVAEEAALPPVGGDMADRTQNVDALIRLATIDQHIVDLQVQLQQPQARVAAATDGAGVGSTVWLRFDGESGDGDPYVIGYAEQARAHENIVTVASPLGQAVLGAKANSEISYAGPRHRRVTATVTRVEP